MPTPATPDRTVVLSALGRELAVFNLDVSTGDLRQIQSLFMPARVQYAWPNSARTLLYVATSDAGYKANPKRPDHFVQALRIGPDGTLDVHGRAVRLGNRPLHVTLDKAEQYILLAYNDPPDVTVHRIAPDGSVGEQVAQPELDFGITVHQVRVTPPGNVVVVPACGHDPHGEEPGSVGLFSFRDGRLASLARMEADPARAERWRGVPNGAHGFAARHVAFHPTRPWMYLCVETTGEIRLYDYDDTGVALQPRAIHGTLDGCRPGASSQMASAIHVHPNGRYVYVSNRAWDTELLDGRPVFVGGVNDIAVFSLDETTGEPSLIQHADTGGLVPRTFGIDATGSVLVVGNEDAGFVRAAEGTERVVPSLVVFRIGEDGRLTPLLRHDLADNGEICFWVGVVSLPT